MKAIGLQKANKRLAAARSAFARVRESKSFDEFEHAWTDFLLATNAIWEILKATCRGHPTNEPWFGIQLNKQRKDPLLQYMHQARNSDEHGLEPVTAMRGGSLEIKGNNIVIEGLHMSGRTITIQKMQGVKPGDVTVRQPHVALVTVRNSKFGDTFDPPQEHLGQKIENPTPLTVGALFLTFMEGLVEEASLRPR